LEGLRARLAFGRHDEQIKVPLPIGGLVIASTIDRTKICSFGSAQYSAVMALQSAAQRLTLQKKCRLEDIR
jgi:hypothetical protein